MRKLEMSMCATVVASVLALPALAQEKPGTVARIGIFKPKPGAAAQYEQGRKKHFDFHRKVNDTWSWFTWQTISGEHEGTYLTGTFGHQWKDFDAWEKLDQADTADGNANMGPSLESEFAAYYEMIPDASRPAGGKEPSPMVQVTHFFVKPAGVEAFVAALKEAKTALDKADWPTHSSWYRLVSGGEGPEFVLATSRASWADMEPSAKTLAQTLAEVYGPQKAVAVIQAVVGNTSHTYSELLRYRPDLSYIPAAK
jgi:hypothetical protein